MNPAFVNALGYSWNAEGGGALELLPDSAVLSARSSHVVPTKRAPGFKIRAISFNAAPLSGTKISTSMLRAPSKE